MKKNYGLTKTEEQIMELLWAAKAPMTFREIMDIATSEWGKTWKVQTLVCKKWNLLGRRKVRHVIITMLYVQKNSIFITGQRS